MARLSRPLAAAGAISSLLLCALEGASAQDGPPKPMTFAWPVPCRVRVTDKTTKQGHEAVTRYVVSLSRSGAGGDIRLRLSDNELLSLDGRAATDPAVAPFVGLMTALARAQPDLLLTPQGRVKDVVGIDEAIAAAFADAEAGADERRKAEIARQKRALTTPEAKDAMRREARAFWDAWVADWVGLTLVLDEPLKTTHTLRGPDGADYEAPTTIVRRQGVGTLPGRDSTPPRERDENEPGSAPTLSQVLRTTALDAEQARTALAGWLRKITEATKKPAPEGMFTGLDVTERVLVDTDPATLRPVRAMRESKLTIRRKDREDERLERHEYTFEWDAEGK